MRNKKKNTVEFLAPHEKHTAHPRIHLVFDVLGSCFLQQQLAAPHDLMKPHVEYVSDILTAQ